MKNILKLYLLGAAVFFAGCTDLDEIYYSEIAQNTFFKTKDNIYAALARPYTKWRGTHQFDPWMLQECVSDCFCVSQKGADYADERYRQLQWHTWTPDNSAIYNTYFQMGEGISYALAMIDELSDLDYPSFGLTEQEAERLKKEEVIRKLPDRRAATIRQAFDQMERSMGKQAFRRKFRTITTDNGPEFLEHEQLIRSIYGGKRFRVYYCHSYAAWEKGTNENSNRIIRRFFPKGTDFSRVTRRQVADVETWMNNYPRRSLGWRCPTEV